MFHQAPRNFSWVLVNELAGSACPSSESELQWLQQQKIKHIVTASKEAQPPREGLQGFKTTLINIPNFKGPTEKQFVDFTKYCVQAKENQEPILVHCRFGVGRTGVLLACYLIAFQGLDPEVAIKKIRETRPHSIETKEQEKSVLGYAYWLQHQSKIKIPT